MKFRIRHSIQVLAPGSSLRRRVAYSLAIVRLILVPVIFLAVYYLFEMGVIVDRIVNVDAPASTMAEQASIQMLETRRAERNYLLLRDAADLRANRESVRTLRNTLDQMSQLEPDETGAIGNASTALDRYQKQFEDAAAALPQAPSPAENIQAVVRAYELDLNSLLKESQRKKRSQLVNELRDRVGSFDAQISTTVQNADPALRAAAPDLQSSSAEFLSTMSELETRNWSRVQDDHEKARQLIKNAEWSLGIVSALTFLFSVWISFILPQQVVKPLLSLKEAVDRAAVGDTEIHFEIQGKGELVQLANSVRRLVARMQRTSQESGPT